MKAILLTLIMVTFFGTISEEKILWQENNKLSWSDFKAKQKPQNDFVATTSSGISFSYSYSFKNNKMSSKFSVQSYFYPEKSWYNPLDATPHILKHEQTHFDISELHARILRKKITNFSFTKNIKTEMDALYQKQEIARRAMQEKFDKETDHSRNKEKEKLWEDYVATQLQAYEQWK